MRNWFQSIMLMLIIFNLSNMDMEAIKWLTVLIEKVIEDHLLLEVLNSIQWKSLGKDKDVVKKSKFHTNLDTEVLLLLIMVMAIVTTISI